MFAIRTRLGIMIALAVAFVTNSVQAAVDFSGLTDLINATFDVIDVITSRGSSLIDLVILFAILGIVSIVVYGFIGKLFTKIGEQGMGRK